MGSAYVGKIVIYLFITLEYPESSPLVAWCFKPAGQLGRRMYCIYYW
jgi:hypothetical protein